MESKEVFTIWIWDLPRQLALRAEKGPKNTICKKNLSRETTVPAVLEPCPWLTVPHRNWSVFTKDLFSQSSSKSVSSYQTIS